MANGASGRPAPIRTGLEDELKRRPAAAPVDATPTLRAPARPPAPPAPSPVQGPPKMAPTPFERSFGTPVERVAQSLHSDTDPAEIEGLVAKGRQQGMPDEKIAEEAIQDAGNKRMRSYVEQVREIEDRYGRDSREAVEAKVSAQKNQQKVFQVLAGLGSALAGQSPQQFQQFLGQWNAEIERPLADFEAGRKRDLESLKTMREAETLDAMRAADPATQALFGRAMGSDTVGGVPISQIPGEGLQPLLGSAIALRNAEKGPASRTTPLSDPMRSILEATYPDQAEQIGQLTALEEGRLASTALGGREQRRGVQGRFDLGQLRTVQKGYDQQVKTLRDRSEDLELVKKLLAQARAGNPIAAQGVIVPLARAAGERGVLTDRDVGRWSGTRSLLGRVAQWVETNRSGQLTPENLESLEDVVKGFDEAIRFGLERKTDQFSSRLQQSSGFSPEEARAWLLGESLPTEQPSSDEEAREVPEPTTESAPAPTAPTGATVRVTNGRETYDIPIEDLEDAQADGFRRVGN